MPKILRKELIRKPDVFYYEVEAPLLAKKARPGQFVIIRLHEKGERIPLSLAGIDPEGGSISLIVMAIGKTTSEMSTLNKGDEILDLCGPLGLPTHIENYGRVVLIGGGFGVAPLYPIAQALKEAGNHVTMIMGARSSDLLIYEEEMSSVCNSVIVTTDDGSKGLKGIVTDALKKEIDENGADMVMAIGPAVMMKAVSEMTRPAGIRTIVSLNTIMIDGTGMCGGCRVTVDGDTRFACSDGPDFDGHKVNWDLLIERQRTYMYEEQESFAQWKKRHAHMLVEEK
ncbi:MAG: sulfide/dihydroorotate dehydrogenase-like FAD/NAD-binding protein [Nitrospirota bacterium]|nr:MAG: sulfide/dihydroorotate dehydrogenase-like FAD/NAD-binding protein [Nitrospirota bacterium]